MGLDFRGADVSWAYSGFMRFRQRVVNGAGYMGDLREMYGHGLPAAMKKDDIYDFIDHSDCDGELTPEQMRKIEPRLRAIVSLWPDGDTDKTRGLALCDGMRACIQAGENLEFI